MKFRHRIQISSHFYCQKKAHGKQRKVIKYIKSVDKEDYTWWPLTIITQMECDRQSGLHFLNMIYQEILPSQNPQCYWPFQREK